METLNPSTAKAVPLPLDKGGRFCEAPLCKGEQHVSVVGIGIYAVAVAKELSPIGD